MATFFGNNDESTLLDVVDFLRREAAPYFRKAAQTKIQRDRLAALSAAQALHSAAAYIEMNARNGPLPDLTRLRIRPSEALLAAAQAREKGWLSEQEAAEQLHEIDAEGTA